MSNNDKNGIDDKNVNSYPQMMTDKLPMMPLMTPSNNPAHHTMTATGPAQYNIPSPTPLNLNPMLTQTNLPPSNSLPPAPLLYVTTGYTYAKCQTQ